LKFKIFPKNIAAGWTTFIRSVLLILFVAKELRLEKFSISHHRNVFFLSQTSYTICIVIDKLMRTEFRMQGIEPGAAEHILFWGG
jgi:hypothetical protein